MKCDVLYVVGLCSKRHEVVAPIAAKLYKAVDDLFGPDFKDNWLVLVSVCTLTYIHPYECKMDSEMYVCDD